MEEDAQLRKCARMKNHLTDLFKAYNKEKAKTSRHALLSHALSPDQGCLESVRRFRQDKKVIETLLAELRELMRGHVTKTRYNTCLGLITAYLMFR